MNSTAAYIVSLLIILPISFALGFFFPTIPYITFPLAILLGAYGISALQKELTKPVK